GRCYADPAAKRTMHGLDPSEPAGVGHLGNAAPGRLQETARRFHTLRLDVARRGRAHLTAEYSREVTRAHPRAARERADRKVTLQVVADPRLHVAHAVSLSEVTGELHAELRLPAGTAQVHDEPARDGEGELATTVVLDQVEREIDTGRDAGGRAHVAVAHED